MLIPLIPAGGKSSVCLYPPESNHSSRHHGSPSKAAHCSGGCGSTSVYREGNRSSQLRSCSTSAAKKASLKIRFFIPYIWVERACCLHIHLIFFYFCSCSKTSVFGTAPLGLTEKAAERRFFRELVPKLTRTVGSQF